MNGRVRKIIKKKLAVVGLRISAISELPLIGKVDDPEGFLENVIDNKSEKDISYRLTVYAKGHLKVNISTLEHTVNEIVKLIGNHGYLLEIHIN